MAAVAVGLALDRAYAPTLFTRSTSNLGDRLTILAILLAPCVVLGAMALLGMRVLFPGFDGGPWPGSDVTGGPRARPTVAIGLMGLVMRAVVGLAE